MKPSAEQGGVDTADAAIVGVLAAEREAREAIARARLEVERIAEDARLQARTIAERTERRIRVIGGGFEREVAARLALIDAAIAELDTTQPPGAAELDALQRAVDAIARELAGVAP